MMQRFRSLPIPYMQGNIAAIGWLIVLNLVFNILANMSFKLSALASNWKGFLTWQVVGNLAGFITVLTLTGLLKHLPLSVAYPMTMGLAILGVQLVAARMIFHESVTPIQYTGVVLILVGIFCIQRS